MKFINLPELKPITPTNISVYKKAVIAELIPLKRLQLLDKENYLDEFATEEEKEKARDNLGILSLNFCTKDELIGLINILQTEIQGLEKAVDEASARLDVVEYYNKLDDGATYTSDIKSNILSTETGTYSILYLDENGDVLDSYAEISQITKSS